MSEAPGWLVAEVAEGIQRLLVLRLEGCPPADAVEAVALAWADALLVRGRWEQQRDAGRLRQAFRSLAAHVQRWPAPAELWAHLPAAQEPMRLAAPPTPPSAEQRARIAQMLAEMKAAMTSGRHDRRPQ